MKNEDKLKRLGLAGREKYYYTGGAKGLWLGLTGGTATVCIIPYPRVSGTGYGTGYVRGISYCNPRDQFSKKLGRAIALGRAIKALECGESSDPVPQNAPVSILRRNLGIEFLSEFNPSLSEFEQRLFRKRPYEIKIEGACDTITVQGEPVVILGYEEIELFLHHPPMDLELLKEHPGEFTTNIAPVRPSRAPKLWRVSEAKTGRSVTEVALYPEAAIEEARQLLEKVGLDEMKARIAYWLATGETRNG